MMNVHDECEALTGLCMNVQECARNVQEYTDVHDCALLCMNVPEIFSMFTPPAHRYRIFFCVHESVCMNLD